MARDGRRLCDILTESAIAGAMKSRNWYGSGLRMDGLLKPSTAPLDRSLLLVRHQCR